MLKGSIFAMKLGVWRNATRLNLRSLPFISSPYSFSIRSSMTARTTIVDRTQFNQGKPSKGFIAQTLGFIGFSFVLLNTTKSHCLEEEKQKEEIPTLYQYSICPFCHRVKAYLDYLQIPYQSIEVNPLTKSEIKFSKEYKKVPIAVFSTSNGDISTTQKLTTVADSNQIISYITDRYIASNAETNINLKSFIPEDTEYWNEWSEKKLAVLLYPNITRSFKESWECFEYTSKIEEWNVLERKVVHAVGAIAMLFANGKIKKKYNIQNEREELYRILEYWTDAIGDKAFLHGTEITLPDLLVYGVLRSIEGVQTFKDVMQKNSSLAQWYQRVAKIVVSQDLKKR